jgi:hypothetical protein
MPQRVAAALLDLNRVQGVVPARVEPEQAEALLDPEAVDQLEAALEAAEAALGEADHKLAQQNSRSSRYATISLLTFHIWDCMNLAESGAVSHIQYGVRDSPTKFSSLAWELSTAIRQDDLLQKYWHRHR